MPHLRFALPCRCTIRSFNPSGSIERSVLSDPAVSQSRCGWVTSFLHPCAASPPPCGWSQPTMPFLLITHRSSQAVLPYVWLIPSSIKISLRYHVSNNLSNYQACQVNDSKVRSINKILYLIYLDH